MALSSRLVPLPAGKATIVQPSSPRAVDVELLAHSDILVGGADLTAENGYAVSASNPFRWRLAAGESLFALSVPSDAVVSVLSN